MEIWKCPSLVSQGGKPRQERQEKARSFVKSNVEPDSSQLSPSHVEIACSVCLLIGCQDPLLIVSGQIVWRRTFIRHAVAWQWLVFWKKGIYEHESVSYSHAGNGPRRC
jgi:hypothetical protein